MPAGPQPPRSAPSSHDDRRGGRASNDASAPRTPSEVRDGRGGTSIGGPGDLKGSYRLRDILDPLIAKRDERDRQSGSDLIANRTRETDTPGFGKRLQPGRYIDPVTKQICPLDDDVPEMDADAEAHLLAWGALRVLFVDRFLDFDRAIDCIYRAGKIRHDAVAGGIEDAPMMSGDQSVEDRPMGLECAQRADFVQPHQAAVLGDVGRKDYRELSFDDLVVRHRALLKGAHTKAQTFDALIYSIDPRCLLPSSALLLSAVRAQPALRYGTGTTGRSSRNPSGPVPMVCAVLTGKCDFVNY